MGVISFFRAGSEEFPNKVPACLRDSPVELNGWSIVRTCGASQSKAPVYNAGALGLLRFVIITIQYCIEFSDWSLFEYEIVYVGSVFLNNVD